jgi:hypothetical protein
MCVPPSPYDLRLHGLGWPAKAGFARQVGTGTFRGHRVVSLEGLGNSGNGTHPLSGDEVAYEAVTHTPVELRTVNRNGPTRFRGVFNATVVKLLPDVSGKSVTFSVPDGGAPRNADLKEVDFRKASLAQAREVLGRPPLWLGPSYQGHRLRFVQTAREGSEAGNGGAAGLVPAVRLDYGPFRIDEFGDQRPLWLVRAAPPGAVLAGSNVVSLERDGVGVQAEGAAANWAEPARALALAKALRPVPGR